jgi:hypothetical protein
MPTDKQLIAGKDPKEISNIVTMLKKRNPEKKDDINSKTVRDIHWMCGRSRVISYKIFQDMGYKTAKPNQVLSSEQKRKLREVLIKMGRNG